MQTMKDVLTLVMFGTCQVMLRKQFLSSFFENMISYIG